MLAAKNGFAGEVAGSRHRWSGAALTNKVGRAQRQGAAPTRPCLVQVSPSVRAAWPPGLVQNGCFTWAQILNPQGPQPAGTPWGALGGYRCLGTLLSALLLPCAPGRADAKAQGQAAPAAVLCCKKRPCCKGKGKKCPTRLKERTGEAAPRRPRPCEALRQGAEVANKSPYGTRLTLPAPNPVRMSKRHCTSLVFLIFETSPLLEARHCSACEAHRK